MLELVCTVPLLGTLFSGCAQPLPLASGYVEGDYVLIAPVAVTQLAQINVKRGDRVTKGEALAVAERRDARISLTGAQADLARAQSQLSNLLEGARSEEIDVIKAGLASATAQIAETEKEVERLRKLLQNGVVTQTQFDSAVTKLDVARAKKAEVEAKLAVAQLPARPYQIAAAEAAVAQAQARVDAANWQLGKRTLTAPADGIVTEILRSTGEIASPQAPVFSILPDGAVTLRLYVPEPAISQISIGTQLDVRCDGCGDNAHATVTYVSDSPEFTPPVIYSLENRQKLVYLIEARPDPDASGLKPGQVVDVDMSDHSK